MCRAVKMFVVLVFVMCFAVGISWAHCEQHSGKPVTIRKGYASTNMQEPLVLAGLIRKDHKPAPVSAPKKAVAATKKERPKTIEPAKSRDSREDRADETAQAKQLEELQGRLATTSDPRERRRLEKEIQVLMEEKTHPEHPLGGPPGQTGIKPDSANVTPPGPYATPGAGRKVGPIKSQEVEAVATPSDSRRSVGTQNRESGGRGSSRRR